MVAYPLQFFKQLGCTGAWDQCVDDNMLVLARDSLQRLQKADPVRCRWEVKADGNATVWTDASMMSIGVVIEVDGYVVEDASWLRKKADVLHINLAELEVVGRGINLAITWG